MPQTVERTATRSVSRQTNLAETNDCGITVFPTALGWFALAGSGDSVVALTIGHASSESAYSAVSRRLPAEMASIPHQSADWNPPLRRRLEDYALGIAVDFEDVAVSFPEMTDFQTAIVAATRRLGYGETSTYAGLAEAAGYPRAARAVGNVMAANRVPIIVPCHRVVAAGERLGGFSAPQGVDLKRRMLELEAAAGA